MEVEFILGIVSAVGPMECWTITGSDLMKYMDRNRKKINEWTVRIASLLLTRMILKRYAKKLYQKLSRVLTQGPWSNLSETVSTDDAYIARFAGRLLASYRSPELMEKAVNMRWSVSSFVLQGLEADVNTSHEAQERAERGLQAKARDLVGSLGRMGVHITGSELDSLLQAVYRHPEEIRKAIRILKTAFEDVKV